LSSWLYISLFWFCLSELLYTTRLAYRLFCITYITSRELLPSPLFRASYIAFVTAGCTGFFCWHKNCGPCLLLAYCSTYMPPYMPTLFTIFCHVFVQHPRAHSAFMGSWRFFYNAYIAFAVQTYYAAGVCVVSQGSPCFATCRRSAAFLGFCLLPCDSAVLPAHMLWLSTFLCAMLLPTHTCLLPALLFLLPSLPHTLQHLPLITAFMHLAFYFGMGCYMLADWRGPCLLYTILS